MYNGLTSEYWMEISSTEECQIQTSLCIDCSKEQAQVHVSRCTSTYLNYLYYSDIAEKYVDMVFLCVGGMANLLLLLTLVQREFANITTFFYIRLIALVGLLLTAVQLAYKIIDYYSIDWTSSDYNANFLQLVIALPDGIKLLISTFSVFLGLDRLIALNKPLLYAKINNRKFVLIAFGFSILVGCLELIEFGKYTIDRATQSNAYYNDSILDTGELPMNPIEEIVLAIRLAELAAMIGFALAIIVRLKRHSKLMKSVMTGDVVLAQERLMTRLCHFQILELIVIVMDLFVLCLNDLAMLIPCLGQMFDRHRFDQFLYCQPFFVFAYATVILRNTSLQFTNFILFFLFLIFSPSFRNGFLRFIRSPFRCKKSTVTVIGQKRITIVPVIAVVAHQ